MNYERELEKIGERVGLMRNLAIMLNLFVLTSIGAFMFIPGIIEPIVKIYLVSVSGFALVGITLALLLARKDSTATLFFTGLSLLISGIFLGVAIMAVQKLVIK